MSKILSGDNAGSYQRWEVPSVDPAPAQPDVPQVSQQELEDIHQQAHAKGYQMGRWEGMNAGREELEKQGARLSGLMRAFTHPLEQVDEQVQRELVLLAGAIASQLVHREIKADPSILNDIVRNAVNALHSTSQRVDVHLSPQDAELVRDALKSPDSDQSWHVVEDASLQCGDVRVVANNTFVDASLRSRLHKLIAELLDTEVGEVTDKLESSDCGEPDE